jgi:hypothetical protein
MEPASEVYSQSLGSTLDKRLRVGKQAFRRTQLALASVVILRG